MTDEWCLLGLGEDQVVRVAASFEAMNEALNLALRRGCSLVDAAVDWTGSGRGEAKPSVIGVRYIRFLKPL